MSVFTLRGGVFVLSCSLVSALAQPARAQLIIQKSLSPAMVVTMAQTAMETCKASGYRVSVTIFSEMPAKSSFSYAVKGSGHTMENSQRKAYTARTFRVPSGVWAENLAKDPIRAGQFRTGVIAFAGAPPIKVGDDVIGAIGVSGAPGGEKDKACAKAAMEQDRRPVKEAIGSLSLITSQAGGGTS